MKDFFEIILNLDKLLASYEDGDLLTFLEIKELFEKIESVLSKDGSLSSFYNIELIEKVKALNNLKKDQVYNSIVSFVNSIKGQVQKIDKEIKDSDLITVPEKSDKTEYSQSYFDNLIDDKEMLTKFMEELKEHLDNAQVALLDLEYDPTNSENINKVFRCFHTAKSSSAFLGVKNIEDISHIMEDLLVLIRDGKVKINSQLVDVIFYGIGFIRDLSAVLINNDFNIKKTIEIYLKIDIFEYISKIKSIIENYHKKKIGEILVDDGKLNDATVKKIIDKQSDENKKFGEIAIEEKLISQDDLRNAISKQNASVKKINYVKVSNERLNNLIDMVGELVIVQSMIRDILKEKNLAEQSNERNITQLEAITTNIKNIVLSMGMVPIAEIFNKLRVVIRNVSHELGKTIDVKMFGEETELDRNIIECIYDPLVHLVRNSCDHGIESQEIREKNGKNPMGQITISANHKGSAIEISVKDDGKGIDRQKVIEKALKNGLLKEENIPGLTDKDINNLIFLPGFSTAEKVTEVSGRGVGLDVVKKNIDDIHGKIDILTKNGEYTNFIIKIPLTLAIIDGFVTIVGEKKYIFPFVLIDEIIVPKIEMISTLDNGEMVLFNRNKYIPLIWSFDFFNEINYNKNIEEKIVIIIIFENKKYGIVVDKVLGKQEIVIKSLNEVLHRYRKIFSGGTIFGDGSIGFVVDIDEFMEMARKK
ncbi:MAG TPA: chemotaxis protein CheA [Spirochaetota bacterium]|nr:chemotaxis protein CheA [Spirochaetota bacterium]